MSATETLRSARLVARTSCGFCEGTHGQPAGICRDASRHCRGTRPGFVRATKENP